MAAWPPAAAGPHAYAASTAMARKPPARRHGQLHKPSATLEGHHDCSARLMNSKLPDALVRNTPLARIY